MALNLDDNKRPYFKQLNLDETFDEISTAFNSLEASIPTKGYTEYVALVNQSSTNNPTVTVLKNDLGGTPVWTRTGTGSYKMTLAGVFTTNKTYVMIGQNYQNNYGELTYAYWNSTNDVYIETVNASNTPTDGLLVIRTIEVRVYN
jgi:hypothetical protein